MAFYDVFSLFDGCVVVYQPANQPTNHINDYGGFGDYVLLIARLVLETSEKKPFEQTHKKCCEGTMYISKSHTSSHLPWCWPKWVGICMSARRCFQPETARYALNFCVDECEVEFPARLGILNYEPKLVTVQLIYSHGRVVRENYISHSRFGIFAKFCPCVTRKFGGGVDWL